MTQPISCEVAGGEPYQELPTIPEDAFAEPLNLDIRGNELFDVAVTEFWSEVASIVPDHVYFRSIECNTFHPTSRTRGLLIRGTGTWDGAVSQVKKAAQIIGRSFACQLREASLATGYVLVHQHWGIDVTRYENAFSVSESSAMEPATVELLASAKSHMISHAANRTNLSDIMSKDEIDALRKKWDEIDAQKNEQAEPDDLLGLVDEEPCTCIAILNGHEAGCPYAKGSG